MCFKVLADERHTDVMCGLVSLVLTAESNQPPSLLWNETCSWVDYLITPHKLVQTSLKF